MLDIISTIAKVAQSIFGLRDSLQKARKERKSEVAEYLNALAQTIESVAQSLRRGEYPSGSCQELAVHAQNLPGVISDLVGNEEAEYLGSQLKEVWEIERLFAELDGLPVNLREARLTELETAAGLYRATADLVRFSP